MIKRKLFVIIIYPIISTILIIGNIVISSNMPKLAAEELKREDGLSVHVIPKRVAEIDKAKQVKWGFMVSQTYELRSPLERPIFNKPERQHCFGHGHKHISRRYRNYNIFRFPLSKYY